MLSNTRKRNPGKETRVKFILGLSANRPSNIWGLNYPSESLLHLL